METMAPWLLKTTGSKHPSARPHGMPLCDDKLAEMETTLEKLVMGDNYDVYAVGKGEGIPSPWLRNEWKRCLIW